ncbi:hypothetical protein [Streptomyces coelicoflavus]|uniref:hypothetical protein n=1 Tax=Streptomyces coelicoflavus TaxID=285562 RepID=UPI003632690E
MATGEFGEDPARLGEADPPAQSVSVIGGPPGVIPDASAGARYFLTVLRSTPSDVASALFERPAYQWT